MKKIFAITIAIVMMMAMTTTAFAAETVDKNGGNCTIDVSGTYTPGAAADTVVSVDISWDAMSFTYTGASQGTWNPETHSYSGGSAGGWSTNKPGITVTNHSNTGIEADFSFAAASGVTTTGSFYASANATTALTAAEQKLSLATAVGTERANAPSGVLYFGVSGDAISENKALGTITVSIAKWTEVSTDAALRAAINKGGNIRLTGDIELVRKIPIHQRTVKIDLNDHTISNSNIGSTFYIGDTTSLTLLNGTISHSTTSAIDNYGTLLVENCTITGWMHSYYHYSGNATFKDCTFHGFCVLDGTGCIKLLGTTALDASTADSSYKGIRIAAEATGTVLCHFNPAVHVFAGDITDNANGTWTVSATTSD